MKSRPAAPIATACLVATTVAAYCVERAADGQAICQTWGLVPARLIRSGEVASLVTSMFLHDPSSLLHIGGNLLFLAIFGPVVERALGSTRFLALYLAAGVGGALMHILVNPAATVPMVGASGAVWGVMAVCAVIRPRTLPFVAAYFLFNLLALLFPQSPLAMPGTALGAHVGGFVVGFLVLALARTTRGSVIEATQ